ncbi:YdbH domain-containing protein [Sphingomonadaceae bacterium LXI357]|uniref:YdbH domain-containing protein n=1 Tax=Stakelama marina TaxID=2826939 RepID=A0A8T4IHZ1_9SPHN|nr:YdbH domain-containing protein [Stakelama marina]
MDDEPEAVSDARGRRGVSRLARVLAIVGAVLVVLLAGLWLQRKPIANHFVRNELERRGVPARYHIAELGLSTQRLTNVVIGDPAHPDLVADWVEVDTDVGLSGASVTGLRAGHVRLHGRLSGGKLSLGAIDKLLPPPTGKPFALPALDVSVADARMRLETPAGTVGLKVAGSGVLNDGFAGRLAAVAEHLDAGGCAVERAVASVAVSIADGQPSLKGPVRATEAKCGDVALNRAAANVDATLGEALDRWRGSTTIGAALLSMPQGKARNLSGDVTFDGGPQRTKGTVELASRRFAAPQLSGASLDISGRYVAGSAGNRFVGNVHAGGARLSQAAIDRVAALGGGAQGTPVGPLVDRLTRAVAVAGRSAEVRAELTAGLTGQRGEIGVSRLTFDARSGAQVTLSGGRGIRYRWPDAGLTLDGVLAMSGGDLPEAAIRLAQTAPGGPVSGTAIVQPYSANGARLALTPVEFSAAPDGNTRFSTRATLTGPLGNGGVDKLSLPLSGYWNGGARLTVNRKCVPMGFDRLAISGLVLDKARFTVCPQDGALLRVDGSRIGGGARIASPDLTGRIGSTPLTLAASGSAFRFTDNGFTLSDVAARLGQDSVTRIDVGHLTGRIAGGAVAGSFAGGAGQIGNVPLLMSDAAGDWRLAGGKLTLTGGLKIDDAQTDNKRFNTLESDDFTMTLVNSDISAGGVLKVPDSGVKVTDVQIAHDLSDGTGHADLAVPGITFGDTVQPSDITPLTFGVVANVQGTLSGHGHIEWDSAGVRSSGDFQTAGTDLAAAFGPVKGLSTKVHFTDLLGLVSAPDQVATVAEINTGIAVDDGEIRYKLLPDQRVRIDSASWPFAGGELTLDPTTLDFGQSRERRLTFRLKGVDAAQFVQRFDLSNITATGTFDGVLPMIFDENGGRIEGGHLETRTGGGSLAYTGEITQKDLGTWGNMAFQALRALRYDDLKITMNGPLAGEMVTQIKFRGVKQGEGAKSNFLIRRLAKLPFIFNIRIEAPFRQLLHSIQAYYDPSKLDTSKLPALIEQERKAAQAKREQDAPQADKRVQPAESEDMP